MPQLFDIEEIWVNPVSAADLYNIERSQHDNPDGGGGDTYIQVNKSQIPGLLKFLKVASVPDKGSPITIQVRDQVRPELPAEDVEFATKSQDRMRISRQNRHRRRCSRLSAWSPENGFPTLEEGETTEDAKALLNEIGGLRVFLARTSDGTVWAGFTTGSGSGADRVQPFADVLWGDTAGGYWP